MSEPASGHDETQTSEEVLLDRVEHFETSDLGYYAYTQGGRTLIVVKVLTLQPPIEDADNYLTLLWVQAPEAYYALAQQIVRGTPRPWFVVRRYDVALGLDFFHAWADNYAERLQLEVLAAQLEEVWTTEHGPAA